MRREVGMQEAALIVFHVIREVVAVGVLLTRDALAPLSCEEGVITRQEMQNVSSGELLVPRFPNEEKDDDQRGPSGSQLNNKKEPEGDDYEEEPMA